MKPDETVKAKLPLFLGNMSSKSIGAYMLYLGTARAWGPQAASSQRKELLAVNGQRSAGEF
jgi:hypothetical protein